MNLKTLAEQKGFTVGQLSRFGVRDGEGGVVVPYFDAKGNQYIKYRIRRDPSQANKAGFFWSRGDAPLIPYGLHRPVPYTNGFAWIVEGESDCWTLWSHEIPAIGLPGASVITALEREHLEGLRSIGVVQEPGEAGERFPTRVANRLWDLGYTGKVYAVPLSEKDPRALWLKHKDDFTQALQGDYKTNRRLIERPVPVAAGTRSISMADAFDMPVEETSWLIDGILPEGGIGLLAAPPKAGKTVLARNAALAVARGARFLDRRCKAGTVLWCAFEERQEDVIADFKLMGADRTDPIRFFFGSSPQDAVTWLNAECEAHKVSLLVLDTWHKFALIENINQYAEVNRANEPLMRLAREKNVAQLWLHHTNKGQNQDGAAVLGSQSIFAACDTLLFLSRAVDGSRTLKTVQRRGDDMEPTVVEMDDEKHLRSPGAKYSVDVARAEQKILDTLATGDLDRKTLITESNVRRSVFCSALNSLLAKGLIERTGTGKPISPFSFKIAISSGSQGSHISKGTPGTTSSYGSRTLGTHAELSEPPEPRELSEEEVDDLMRYANKRINEA